MRIGIIAAALLVAGGVVACGPHQAGSTQAPTQAPTSSLAFGSTSQSITVGGRSRSFLVYRPTTLPAAAPLVIVLHGGFGDGAEAERDLHWDGEADAAHFVVAYPDGVDRAWNVGGGCCGSPASSDVDDVGFIEQMVGTIEKQLPIDPDRVYATGISNGGMLAYRLACDTNLFAAIGPDSATLLGSCPSPTPLSVIHIHGTADHNIPYDGGEGDGVARIDGPSVPSLNAMWRQIDGCATPDVTVDGVVTTSVAQCPNGRTVELVTIAGAGHQWPGATPNLVAQRVLGTDPPSTALNATEVIWQFFASHRRS